MDKKHIKHNIEVTVKELVKKILKFRSADKLKIHNGNANYIFRLF